MKFFEQEPVTLKLLEIYLNQNREIEFTLDGHLYFAQPLVNNSNSLKYAILDTESNTWIFQGNLDEIFSFKFRNERTLAQNFDEFEFLYIY